MLPILLSTFRRAYFPRRYAKRSTVLEVPSEGRFLRRLEADGDHILREGD